VRGTTDDVLRRGYEAGVRTYGPLPLSFEAYARHVLEHVRSRLKRCGASADRQSDALAAAHGADLFLSIACETDVPDAWRVLVERVLVTLGPVAGRRGASPAEAHELLAELPGELCAPPPSGGARTRIGTYDGSGSLFAWLAVIIARRVADAHRAGGSRSRPPVLSLDARGGDAGAAEVASDRSAPPEGRVLEQEAVRNLRSALREVWDRLTDREALALLWKHRDGLSQRDIARILDVGEPRVSRILDGAVAKLREGLSRRITAPSGPGSDSAWAHLAEALGSHLASAVPFHDIVDREPPSRD
jgi:RNA polymerase sigma factor (sigma-70 family)